MGTIIDYPKPLLSFLNEFKPYLSKPRFNNFLQITNGIALSSYSTISRISQMFEYRDNSSLNKFLTQSPWDENKLKERLHKITFKNILDLNIFIGDDTLSEKPFAKHMQGANKHYSGMHKRHINGHSILTTGYYDKGGFIPFDTEIYFKKEDAKKLHRRFKTKNKIMCEKIDLAYKAHKPRIMIFDSWYSNNIVLGKLRKYNIYYVTQIKSNRNVTMNRRKRQIANHAKDVRMVDYTTTTIDNKLFRYYETDGFISGLGTVKIVYAQMFLNDENKWSDINFIITGMFFLSAEDIITIYLKRSGIEEFHREAKQQLGLDKYQLTNIRGIERYLFLVMLVYILLMLLNKLLVKSQETSRSIGKLRIFLKEECYTILLRKARIQKIDERRLIAKNLAYSF